MHKPSCDWFSLLFLAEQYMYPVFLLISPYLLVVQGSCMLIYFIFYLLGAEGAVFPGSLETPYVKAEPFHHLR